LVGFTDMIRAGNLDMSTDAAAAARKRLEFFLGAARTFAELDDRIAVQAVNDGIGYFWDIPKGVEGWEAQTARIVNLLTFQHGWLMAKDLSQGYAGVRMVICQGQRADLNLPPVELAEHKLERLVRLLGEVRRTRKLTPNFCSEMAQVGPPCAPHHQTNMAFAKAFLAAETASGLFEKGELAIECELLCDYCGLFFPEACRCATARREDASREAQAQTARVEEAIRCGADRAIRDSLRADLLLPRKRVRQPATVPTRRPDDAQPNLGLPHEAIAYKVQDIEDRGEVRPAVARIAACFRIYSVIRPAPFSPRGLRDRGNALLQRLEAVHTALRRPPGAPHSGRTPISTPAKRPETRRSASDVRSAPGRGRVARSPRRR
jgi:hypothetical protein